ncbi:MAG: SIMPL domain-containing protein [Gammaproteobacteria bacterium]|nr:SIMPL domain-containing protein [Gammaproteobacteria bacterium]
MRVNNNSSAFILGFFIFLGLALLGYFLSTAAIDFKQYDRSVTVKGLSEREFKADIVIWPIEFTLADNDLERLYRTIDDYTFKIKSFLEVNNVRPDEISFSSPAITDKTAQQYGGGPAPQYRYSAIQTVTVYSKHIDAVRGVMGRLSELGKQGIVFSGGGYAYQTEYIFTRLNEVKPEMIEEATRKAREVAEKFASDSQSKLGKIKKASQGQFSIYARDKNNPHIKKVRVVSTVQYYLSD